jgi:hypothetical protein
MKLVYIYGPPAVGKLSVATELSKLTGYRLFHNHLTVDLLRPVFEFGTPPYSKLLHSIRLQVFKEAARQRLPGLIFTYVYAQGVDEPFVNKATHTVERAGGELCFVQLHCDWDALMKRVGDAGRQSTGKIATAELLQRLMTSSNHLATVPDRESLSIDNTTLAPNEVAHQIAFHYELPLLAN